MTLYQLNRLTKYLIENGVDAELPVVLPVKTCIDGIEETVLGEVDGVSLAVADYRPDISPKMAVPTMYKGASLVLHTDDSEFDLQLKNTVNIPNQFPWDNPEPIPGPKEFHYSSFKGQMASLNRTK